MKIRLIALSSSLTLALAGCVLPPKVPPQATLLNSSALGLDGSATPAATNGWWHAFGDPQLDRLIDDAFAANPRLSEVMARVRMAQAQTQAATAASNPGLSLDGQEARERFPVNDIYPPPLGGGTYWRGGLNVNLAWDLDFFGRQAAIIEQNRAYTRAAALDVENARLALAGTLAQAYLDLYRSYALADLAAQTETQQQTILKLAHERLAAGLDTQTDLRLGEASVSQAKLSRLQSEAGIVLAVHRLAAISGHGADAYAGITRPQLDLAAVLKLPERLPVDLLARRPDVLAARARVEAASHGEAAAKAAFYPDINLSAFAGLSAIGLGNLFQSSARTYGAGPALQLPLFDSGQLKASYRAAHADVDAAIADYNNTVLQAVQQTADQLSLIASYQQQIDQNQQTLTASQDALRIAQARFREGLTGRLAVLNTETRVLAAQRTQVDLAEAQAVARVTLLLALGGSFDPDSNHALTGASS